MKISELMTKEVISLTPDQTVIKAADLFAKYGYDGLPVVDSSGTLLGLVSQSDLMLADSHIHIPTILEVFKKFDLYKKDQKFVQDKLERMKKVKVKDIMNLEPPLIYENDPEDTAIVLLSKTHGVSPISVVSANRVLKGVLTRADLFRRYGEGEDKKESKRMKKINLEIEAILKSFEKNYLLISRDRTRAWLLVNITFLISGIIIALAVFF